MNENKLFIEWKYDGRTVFKSLETDYHCGSDMMEIKRNKAEIWFKLQPKTTAPPFILKIKHIPNLDYLEVWTADGKYYQHDLNFSNLTQYQGQPVINEGRDTIGGKPTETTQPLPNTDNSGIPTPPDTRPSTPEPTAEEIEAERKKKEAEELAEQKRQEEEKARLELLQKQKQERVKYDAILRKINNPSIKSLKELPETFESKAISALDNSLLIGVKKETLTEKILERRQGLYFYLVDDGYITNEDLLSAKSKEESIYPRTSFEPLTANILNSYVDLEIEKINKALVKQNKDPKNETKYKLIDRLQPTTPQDLEKWFKGKKGYRLEDEPAREIMSFGNKITIDGKQVDEQENKWSDPNHQEYSLQLQSSYKLPFAYSKIGFDPDNLTFCEKYENPDHGELPIGTGYGKTSKTINCLVNGGKRNIILVCPTDPLAFSAFNSHNPETGWLQQNYKCVYHGVDHGKYEVNINKLGKGLSILTTGFLYGYRTRELLDLTKIKCNWPRTSEKYQQYLKDKKQIKKELNELDPIIVFDEGHYADSKYKKLIQRIIEATDENGKQIYKVLKMSATFTNKPFSISSSFGITSQLVKGWSESDNNGLEKGNTLLFVPDTEDITPEQKKLLKDICCVILDKNNAETSEGISEKTPDGTLIILSNIYEMGFNFKNVKRVISIGWIKTRRLGAGWKYTDPFYQPFSDASATQQRGRGGRFEPAIWETITTDTQETKATNDAGTIFGDASLTGDTSKINYSNFKDIDLVRASISWPTKFGLLPEEILIGVQKGDSLYPTFPHKTPNSYDADLWDRHLKKIKTNKMPPKQSKDLLFMMLETSLKQDWPNLKISLETPLIKDIGWSEERLKKQKPLSEIRSLINAFMAEKLNKLVSEGYDKVEERAKDEKIVKEVADLHNLSNRVKIDIIKEENKENLTLTINA